MIHFVKNCKGSVLIVVLWTLVVVSYLVGDYLIHNQSKTGTAINLMTSFRQQNAIESLFHLTRTDEWKAVFEEYTSEKWVDMVVAGVDLRFRLDTEATRININSAGEAQIREAMVDILEGNDIERAHGLTDKILDWRDTNDLVRANGAEKFQYEAAGFGYHPPDGLFKTLTEVLMVMGMDRDIFWGNPGEQSADPEEEADAPEIVPKSVVEAFTIFGAGTQRLSVLLPLGRNGNRLYAVLFIKEPGSLDVMEYYTAFLEEGQIDL